MCPACLCGGGAAGHNAMRGSGPNRKHAFKDALTHAGCPNPWIDLVCITSSVLANSFNFKRHRRCLSHLLIALLDSGSLQHFDAPERAPSTASEADILTRWTDLRFAPQSGHCIDGSPPRAKLRFSVS